VLETFTVDTFAGRIGDEFVVAYEGERLELRLHLASAWGEPANPGGRAPFSVEFLGPPEPVLPQAIYALEHIDLDRFELFLVPLGPGDGGAMRYEAVFS